ncbi:MAG: penicillin-binding protein 2 [Planctomycetota bacterium]
MPRDPFDRVTRFVAVSGLAALTVVGGRVAWLQTAGDERLAGFTAAAARSTSVDRPRGDLLDRRGRPLATTRFRYQPVVDPTLVPDPPDGWILEVSTALRMDPAELGTALLHALATNDARRDAAEAVAAGDARASGESQAGEREDGVRAAAARIAGAVSERFVPAAKPSESTPLAVGSPLPGDGAGDAGGASVPEKTDQAKRLPVRRYMPVGEAVDESEATRLAERGFRGLWFERRSERVVLSEGELYGLAPIVGKPGRDTSDPEDPGRIGAEAIFNDRLVADDGSVAFVRDARGRVLWVERGTADMGARGADLRLSFDLVIQRIAAEELGRGVVESGAIGGRIVIADPRTGELLAMTDMVRDVPGLAEFPWWDGEGERPRWAPDDGPVRPRFRTILSSPAGSEPALRRVRCITDVYEPGSIFKSLVWAGAVDAGVMPADEIVRTGGGYRTAYGRELSDVTRKTEHTWDEVLIRSSNIGMAMLSERMSHEDLRGIATRFGFARPTRIGLRNESAGIVTSAAAWSNYTQTSVAMGHEIAVTPVQIVRAFTAIARTGRDAGTMPSLRLEAASSDGPAIVVERVLSREAAERTRRVLEAVAVNASAKLALRVHDEPRPRYRLFGKSGTAEIPMTPPPGKKMPRIRKAYYPEQYISNFVAGGPLEDPAIVVLCVIDDPGPARVRRREHYGSDVAYPVVQRVFERVLPYLGVPSDRMSVSLSR